MTTVTVIPDPTAGHAPARVEPVLFVVFDHAHARLFVDDARGLRELTGALSQRTRGGRFHTVRGDSPGVGEKRYHHIRAEETRRHYHALAARIERALRAERAIGVILGGAHGTVAEFRHGLPRSVARVVLQSVAMNPKTPRRRIMRELAEAARHFVPATQEY